MNHLNVCGVICEYNPLHNGHLYHLSQARLRSGCDYLVAVMSGAFVQRGEPAAFDKWSRARWALQAGADLVLELPAAYCLQSAEGFARGRGRHAGPGPECSPISPSGVRRTTSPSSNASPPF